MRTLARIVITFPLIFLGTNVSAADNLYGTVSGWGQLIDPDGDCSFTIAKDQLRLEMKDGVVRGLVRYPDECWTEMGTALIPDAGTVSAGVQALNTSGQEIEVTFRNFRHNAGFSAADAESSVGIDLKGPQQIAERPITSPPDFREFVNKTKDLQRRSKEIESMNANGRQKLIDDANELFVDPEDQVKMRLAMATLSIMSDEFQAADDHDLAVKTFDRAIESMTAAKDQTVVKFGDQLKYFRDRLQFKLSMIGKPLEIDGETISEEPNVVRE